MIERLLAKWNGLNKLGQRVVLGIIGALFTLIFVFAAYDRVRAILANGTVDTPPQNPDADFSSDRKFLRCLASKVDAGIHVLCAGDLLCYKQQAAEEVEQCDECSRSVWPCWLFF